MKRCRAFTLTAGAGSNAPTPTPILFTSPVTGLGRNYSTAAFETDLPDIESNVSQDNPPFCDRSTGANCVIPPAGGQFYPFFTSTIRDGTCTWQEGPTCWASSTRTATS